MYSQQIFIAMNSSSKEDISMLVYFLQNQYIGELLRNVMYHVLGQRVMQSPASSESTKALVVKSILLDLDALEGIFSLYST